MKTNHEVLTVDEVPIHLELYGDNNQTVLIVNPAIGVKRQLYRAFAEHMAAQDITVVLYNYRGMEDGIEQVPTGVSCDASNWGKLDQQAVINWAQNQLKPEKLFLLGHSIGGQLLGFADSIFAVDGLIHVASQKGDYRLWPLIGRLKLMLLWHVLIPWMSRGETFNAKKLGLGNYPWPAAAAKQWARWGRQKDYLFNPKFGFDLQPWHDFHQPILSFGFTDDDMAPAAAIDGLLNEYGKNNEHIHIEKYRINPQILGLKSIGHFGFFKPEAKTLWQDTATWIHQQQTPQ